MLFRKGAIELDPNATVRPVSRNTYKKDHAFTITTSATKRIWVLHADSADDRESWIEALELAVTELAAKSTA